METRTSRFKILMASLLAAWIFASAARPVQPARLALAILSSEAVPYRENLEGFKARFDGHVSSIVLGDKAPAKHGPPDLVFAIGSSAAEYAVKTFPNTPVLFSMVYYPERHGLSGLGNVAGISLRVPPEAVMEALDTVKPQNKDAFRVGVMYPADRQGDELKSMRAAIKKRGFVMELELVGPDNDPGRAFNALLSRMDALWLVADPEVLPGPEFLQSVLVKALDKKVAVIGLSDAHVRSGALLAVSVDYRLEGGVAAGLADQILIGKAPSEIGVREPQSLSWSLNTRVAAELGWPVPRPARQRFGRVYP